MDPSIMKLLEEDEDETMHSGADVDAFTAALNRDIEGDNSHSQQLGSDSAPLSRGSSYTSNQFVPWQTSNHDVNASHQSLQDSQIMQQMEGNLSDRVLKQHGTDSQNQQQKSDSSQELSSRPLHHIPSLDTYQTPQVEQDTLHASRQMNMQSHEKNTQNPESQQLNLQGMTNQQSMHSSATGTSMEAEASNQPESASGSSSQAAMNVVKQGKQVPFAMLFPHIQPQLDKDRAMQLQTLYHKLKRNEISKDDFVRHMKSTIGDQMLKMAVYKFQCQAARNSQTLPSQLPPQSQASSQQHLKTPIDDSTTLTVESNAQILHEVEKQADLHGARGSQVTSSSLNAVKQERDRSPHPIQGLSNQQQQHLHFSQASFPTFQNSGYNYSPYSSTNVKSSTATPFKQQSDDPQMRQIAAHQNRDATQLGNPTQAMGMMSATKFEKPNSFGEPKRLPGGSLTHMPNNSTIQQTSVQWQQSANKEQRSILSSSMINPKPEPIDHLQQQKSQLSPFSSVHVEPGNSSSESSKDEGIEMQTSIKGFPTSTSMKSSNLVSSSIPSQMDTNTLLSSRAPSVTSPFAPGNNGKTPLKKPSVGQKKPVDTLGSSPPPSGKKQKVSGAFLDQSIEQLNDVTAVSGVNLREEEEQLFSGPKEDSRVSEASRRVVQEEEDRLILEKIPLQKRLTEILAKCGLTKMGSDLERCLSLSMEERMRGLISGLIRLSKQRVDIEKSRHRTIVTSDVRQQIIAMNRKVREEWEKKQAEAEKLQKANDPEGTAVDGDKDKDDGRGKAVKANKEEDDKMRTTAANVAARAAVGGDDMFSKWQLMAEQARQKREGGVDVASGSQPGKDMNSRPLSTPTRNPRDHQEAEKRSQSSTSTTPGAARRAGTNQTIAQTRIARSVLVKDVIAVLEREPQTAKSTMIYRLHERVRSDESS